MIALACSDPPDGRTRWTLRLLADELVALEAVDIDSISPETIRKTLTKNDLQPHRFKQWVIPPDESTDFVFHMENVLSLYQEPYDPDRPFVWFDEHPTQLVEQVREPQSASLGQVEREDYHFEPVGTKNLFLATEPLDGWRAISVTDRRMMEDWVTFMQQLDEEHYPDVESLRVVLDNLHTYDPAAFDDYLPPAEASSCSMHSSFTSRRFTAAG